MAELDFRKLHILLIDDEAFMRSLVERALNEIGVEIVTSAENGRQGLEKLKGSRRPVDLVICDLEMPEMDGLGFVKAMRSDDQISVSKIPVLILTGHAEEETVYDAVKLGINGYLVKPISKNSLEKRLIAAIKNPTLNPGNSA
ncbi:MAG: response regulator [Rhodospirillales bacterium]|jgi:two-component system chemotaxis response regulator CheY|nr:hypothetical protein [Rhodospirillaceae bacterium]MDP6429456.1 response regulator [Rhodospirillales bacterium]MDP6645849.1 response regulator [Rhodospirillales bacterium]MDP6842372.1 response regulator [Rhodospirillales bacterium]|tara:strand:- start:1245 stop:1673 length:429 start_codon:yes stop_codon:yes gene_type:complete